MTKIIMCRQFNSELSNYLLDQLINQFNSLTIENKHPCAYTVIINSMNLIHNWIFAMDPVYYQI